MILGLLKRLFRRPVIRYEDARDRAASGDTGVRAALAVRTDVQPEILYYLAEDEDPEIRRKVARNPHTPAQADLLLANDGDDSVREELAAKIARLAPGLNPHEQDRLRRATYDALELLARDQLPKIRQILSEALKDVAEAPPEVILRLARDAEIAVSGPVLQYSPVLTDDDLLEIIASGPISGALSAISKREGVNTRVADAIAATEDVDAIAVLLGNKSAQIREETLDHLVDRATDIESWHRPLTERPSLSPKAAAKLARFVAASLLRSLADRHDLPTDVAQAVAAVVNRRLQELEQGTAKPVDKTANGEDAAAMLRAQQMKLQNRLTEASIDQALNRGDQAFVIAGLTVLSGLSQTVVRKTVETRSAKGIIAITWKAHLSTAMGQSLQERLLHLPADRVLRSFDGSFPLTNEDMRWQLDFMTE